MSEADEQRAALWRSQKQKRLAFGRFLQSVLKASGEPAKTTKKNWAPLRRS